LKDTYLGKGAGDSAKREEEGKEVKSQSAHYTFRAPGELPFGKLPCSVEISVKK
jgi:hypothetical protein